MPAGLLAELMRVMDLSADAIWLATAAVRLYTPAMEAASIEAQSRRNEELSGATARSRG